MTSPVFDGLAAWVRDEAKWTPEAFETYLRNHPFLRPEQREKCGQLFREAWARLPKGKRDEDTGWMCGAPAGWYDVLGLVYCPKCYVGDDT